MLAFIRGSAPRYHHRASSWRVVSTRRRHSTHHKLCGYLAGLHSFGPDSEYTTFDDAYDAIIHVDEGLLADLEEEQWSTQRKKFVFGSRLVSVIDTESVSEDAKNNTTTTTTIRQLVLNERPNLVQTAVSVAAVAAPYDTTHARPAPLSETHLGGLALALAFWHTANPGRSGPFSPRCVVIGAGGCSLPAVLAANLHHAQPRLVAVEPCAEVREAASKWFGAGASCCNFDLVGGFGEEWLAEVARQKHSLLDVVIIDAEDGLAPPASMRSVSFWRDLVLPVLSVNAILAVNVIADQDEKESLRLLVQDNLPDNYSVVLLPAPPEASVSDRHALLFAVPKGVLELDFDEVDVGRLVDNPAAWLRQVKRCTSKDRNE